jgi:hypothetical protein
MLNNITNRIILFQVVVLFFSIQVSLGQTYNEENNTGQETQEIESATNAFSFIGLNNQVNARNSAIQGNSVFLRQIGSLNQVSVVTATETSEINVLQNGDFNQVDLDYNVNSVYTDLVQNGNFNTIVDYVNDPQEDVSLQLVQDGDYKVFEREGVNSLTRSIKFTQGTPTIIVRSFN